MLCPQLRSYNRQNAVESADFIARRTAPGVVRWFDFNDATYLSGSPTGNYGMTQGSGFPFAYPVLDPSVKASGVSSLRFDIPTSDGNANPSGAWFANFSDDLSFQVDTGQSVYIQMRVRWNQQYYNQIFFGAKTYVDCGAATIIDATHFSVVGNYAALLAAHNAARGHDSGGACVCYAEIVSSVYAGGVTTVTIKPPVMGALATVTEVWYSTPQAGIKLFDVTAGDIAGTPIKKFYSSAEVKMVVQTHYQTRAVFVYSYKQDGGTTGAFIEPYLATDFKIQNAMPSPFCLYSNASGHTGPIAGCFNMAPDEWMTFQLRISPGARVVNGYAGVGDIWNDCKVQLWGANEGQPSVMLLDWDNTKDGWYNLPAWCRNTLDGFIYPVRYGKLWLLPYRSYSDAYQTFPAPGAVWYDEVIISTQRIADPVADTPPYSGALSTLAAGKVRRLATYADPNCLNNGTIPAGRYITDDSGTCLDLSNRRILIFGGGHGNGCSTNIRAFDIDTCTWSNLYETIQSQNQLYANWDIEKGLFLGTTDGVANHPCQRHTYNGTTSSGSKFFMFGTAMPYHPVGSPDALLIDYNTNLGGRICSFDYASKMWTYSGIPFASKPWFFNCAAKYDAISGQIIVAGGIGVGYNNWLGIWLYDPVADTITPIRTTIDWNANSSGGSEIVYIPESDLYYMLDTQSGKVATFQLNRANPVASVFTKLTVTGTPVFDSSIYGVATSYGYVKELHIIGGAISTGGIFNWFDIATRTWFQKQLVNEIGGTNFTSGEEQGCLEYDPVSGCFIFLENSQYSQTPATYAYRPEP